MRLGHFRKRKRARQESKVSGGPSAALSASQTPSDIKNGDHVYFANSYHFLCQNEGNVLAQVEYGIKLNAVIAKKNIVGIQFHPEKSGEVGLQILKNFLNWRY